jgi:16S rRNA C1402 (ribose-2'-O) methylase RsmI
VTAPFMPATMGVRPAFYDASVGKIIRKMEILTPLLDAYIFIFLIRNSTTSDRSLKHIHDLLAFLGKHSMQLRLEPELTRLIEITVQTKLIEELNNAATAVMRGETILTWKSTFDSSTQLKATQLLQSGTYILNKISAVQKAVLVADLVWVEELTKAYNEALRKLVNCLSKFGKKIQNTVEVQTRVKHSLVLPVLMGATYFAVGFMQGR